MHTSTVDRFVTQRRDSWSELSTLTAGASGRGQRLTSEQLRRLGSLYRGAAADLAQARRRFPGDPSLAGLEALVGRARLVVYAHPAARGRIRDFYRRRYWQLVAERPRLLAAAWFFLLVPAAIMFVWALRDPDRAASLLPGRFQGGRDSWRDLGLSGPEQGSVAIEIFTNNIRVSFAAFALGITGGLGTAASLIFNGVILGGVAGVGAANGAGTTVLALVVGHGVLELSVIAVTAAAGMRMGRAITSPGHASRGRALREQATLAVEIVVGTIPWFVLAGLVEGFFTPAGFGPVIATMVGVLLGALYWTLVITLGRRPSRRPRPVASDWRASRTLWT